MRAFRFALAFALAQAASPGPPAFAGSYRLVPAGPMIAPPQSHAATRLADGRVLITGGSATVEQLPVRDTEIFDPATRTFSRGPRLAVARSNHAAMLLPDGRVLVAGGDMVSYVVPTPSAEILDPAGVSTRIGDMAVPRGQGPFLALGSDGAAWIFGGSMEGRFAEVTDLIERLEPGASTWTVAGRQQLPCSGTHVMLGPDRVLRLAGGRHRSSGSALDDACGWWGEETTLTRPPVSQVVRMPAGVVSSALAATVTSADVIAIVDLAPWRLERDAQGWVAAERLLPPATGSRETAVVAAWTEDEVVVVTDVVGVVHADGREPPATFASTTLSRPTVTVVSPDMVLICGGVASANGTGRHRPGGAWLLLREPAGQSSSPPPSDAPDRP